MMTRRDYRAFAEILKTQRQFFKEGEDGLAVLDTVAVLMAQYLIQDNPRFNRDKFLNACEVTA
jgi:hypothetical protein